MALLDSQVAVLANQAANYLASGAVPKRMGNAHVNVVPYQVFATADGQLVIAVGNDGQYRRLCAILGVPDRSVEHTSELQSLMRIPYAVFCLQKKQILIIYNFSTHIHIY